MEVAGLLLTGGASRRMGADKAALSPAGGGTLAGRTAGLLAGVCVIALEVGPGGSGLPAVTDGLPGAGPLAAVATGSRALASRGWTGAALVVATDLPRLDADMLRWLAAHLHPGSVVPVASGRPQPLCARWVGADLALACRLVAGGERSMTALVEAAGPALPAVTPGRAAALDDADTPADARRLGLVIAATGGGRTRPAGDRDGLPPGGGLR
jgi:molybdopterin-guanine dinucleotide biosynthesis protein A